MPPPEHFSRMDHGKCRSDHVTLWLQTLQWLLLQLQDESEFLNLSPQVPPEPSARLVVPTELSSHTRCVLSLTTWSAAVSHPLLSPHFCLSFKTWLSGHPLWEAPRSLPQAQVGVPSGWSLFPGHESVPPNREVVSYSPSHPPDPSPKHRIRQSILHKYFPRLESRFQSI